MDYKKTENGNKIVIETALGHYITKTVFDIVDGILTISQNTKLGEQSVSIGFQNIAGFEKTTHSTSSGSGKQRTTTWHYNLYITKKDGGLIFLFTSTYQPSRDEMYNYLSKNIDLNVCSEQTYNYQLPEKFSKKETMDGLMLTWQNITSKTELFFLVFFFVIFFGAIFFFSKQFITFNITEIFPALILGFIASVGLFLMYYIFTTRLKDQSTLYGLKISRSYIEYSETSIKNNQIKKCINIRLNQIAHIYFKENIGSTPFNDLKLYIENKEEAEKNRFYKSHKFQHFIDFLRGKAHESLNLRVTEQTTIEKLNFEFWIQLSIKQISGIDID